MQTLADSDHPIPNKPSPGLSYQGFLLLGFLGVFVPLCAFDWLARAITGQHLPAWEISFLRTLPSSAPPAWEQFIEWLALGGGVETTVVLSVMGVLTLKRLHRLGDALFVTLSVVGVVLLSLLVRTAVQRVHLAWAGAMVPSFDFGFPSTQAADTLTVSLLAALLFWSTRWRWLAVALGTLYVLTVGLARIYLGLHYPTDILAGWALSLACVSGMVLVRFRFWQRWPWP